MDDSTGRQRIAGGTVEPVKRTTTAKARNQAVPDVADAPGRRYELYDPFAGVTHRARTFDEMVFKAERAQAIRFTVIDADETRTHVHKVDGRWQRPPPQLSIAMNRDEAVRVTKTAAEVRRDREASEAQPSARQGKVVQLQVSDAQGASAPARPEAAVDRAAQVAALEAALNERYVIRRALLRVGSLQVGNTEYRFRGDTSRVAFTESAARLSTNTNSPSVARSMVDVAQARNWQALRLSGNEDFKRMVWLEATVRNVKTVGYEPAPADLDLLRKERDARQVNQVERVAEPTGSVSDSATTKQSARGGGGRKAVLAALEAVLIDRKVPARQREAVMAAAVDNLAKRLAAGQTHKVKVYDQAAPSRRPAITPTRETSRTHDRAQPVR